MVMVSNFEKSPSKKARKLELVENLRWMGHGTHNNYIYSSSSGINAMKLRLSKYHSGWSRAQTIKKSMSLVNAD